MSNTPSSGANLTRALTVALSMHQPHVRTKEMTEAEFRSLNQPRSSLLNDSWPHKILAFRRFYKLPVHSITEPLSAADIETHNAIILEEWNEFWEAVMANDLLEMIDGGLDLIYTVLGLLIHRGVPPHVLDACMEEIHASNLTKANTDGTPLLSEAGKILKGPLYTPANLSMAALKATPSFELPAPVPTTEKETSDA